VVRDIFMKQIIESIQKLKQKNHAVILVHNYQIPEVQDIGDFIGDSLELSRKAAATDAEVIIFCGVHFMAETAAILSPEKKVIIPDPAAGCPLAEMIEPKDVIRLRNENPGCIVVGYVNTSAAVKAELDICCTSANASKVVMSLDKNKPVVFVPDKYLAAYTAFKTNRPMVYWNGYCPTHAKILPQDIFKCKSAYPGAKVMVHPECRPEVTKLADAVVSTSGMLKYAKETDAEVFIVGTEIDMIYRLNKENPGKKFVPASKLAVCPNMKKITLEKVLWSLEELKPQVTIPEEIRVRALAAVNKMIQII